MFNHAPDGYACPFCAVANGVEREGVLTVQDDVVLRDEAVVAFIASHWWPRNKGHVLVVPAAHYENVYDLPDAVGAAVFAAARRVAIALKHGYGCDGVSTRQHNEPAGHQDVWHYHLHVFPRYAGDGLYGSADKAPARPEERRPLAAKLRQALGTTSSGRGA